MVQPNQHPPKNYLRRTIGVFLCFLPVLVPLASLLAGLVRHQANYFSAVGFVVAAASFAALNIYWCVIRPSLFRRRHGPEAEYSGPSPVPIFGDILAVLSALFGFGAIGTAALALLVVALNPGGTPWFVFVTWRDSALWDSTP